MFELHATLAADSLAVMEDADIMIRLIDDVRFPWALVIPKVPGARDLHDLDTVAFEKAMRVSRRLGALMQQAFKADKINTAAIGNMVAQLHIHVVARRRDDAAWPAPVWGSGPMVRLAPAEAERRIGEIARGLRLD